MQLPDFSESHESKIAWMIETNGWALEAVAPRVDTTPPIPAYAYSIGLPAAVGFPDVAVFGLTPVAARGLVGLVVDARAAGVEIPIGVELVGLLDNELRCLFAPLDMDLHADWFTTAIEFADGQQVEMVQMLYPDRSGWLPYESGYDAAMRYAQPVLGATGEPG